MDTGFSWVRIDKGTIHCNFRYLNQEQVETVINYLLSFYEYRNVTANIVDLGAPLLPDSDGDGHVGDHYRPSGGDPNQSYYFLVELHRHGTIIPQGSIEIMKTAINGIAQHAIIPESIFIQKLKTNYLTVGDEETLTAISTLSSGTDLTWSVDDNTIISITPDGMNCAIEALLPGTASITASVEVDEEAPLEIKIISQPSAYWVNNIYKYVGDTITYKVYKGKLYPSDTQFGVDFTFTHDNYYECVYDSTVETKYKWVASTYDPSQTPVQVEYKDIYELIVRTFIKILTKEKQRICLHHYEIMQATTPSAGLPINWSSSSDSLSFEDDVSTGSTVTIVGDRVGTAVLSVSITDGYGSYMDSMPITVFAIDVKPSTLKMVVGSSPKPAKIAKADIFDISAQTVVNWVSSNPAIASAEAVNPDPSDTATFAQCNITALGVGQTFISAIAEDATDGTSYSDSVKVTVGNVAINVPESNIIQLITGSTTKTLTCELTAGFEVDTTDGWTSSNTSVVSINSISGTGGNTAVIEGLDVGTSLITVTARLGSSVDTDTLLIQVVDADYVTLGEMKTFTHGMYNGHGVIDWDHPTGEEGALEVDGTGLDLATEPEVESFVDNLFNANDSESESSDESDEGEESGE